MASRNENGAPVTRKRKKVDTQKIKDQERVQKWLQPVVVIGPNDIVLNPHLYKVKIEQEEWEVKPEVGVQVQVNEEVLEDDDVAIDLEEGVLVVKEEADMQLVTTGEDELEGSSINAEDSQPVPTKSLKQIAEENLKLKKLIQDKNKRIMISQQELEKYGKYQTEQLKKNIQSLSTKTSEQQTKILKLEQILENWTEQQHEITNEITVFYGQFAWQYGDWDEVVGISKQPKRLPAFPNKLAIVDNFNDEPNLSRKKIVSLLEKVGQSVKHFTYYRESRAFNGDWRWPKTFVHWLKLLPNLENVQLRYKKEEKFISPDWDIYDCPDFPKSPKLKHLDDSICRFPQKLFRMALWSNRQLTSLVLHSRTFDFGGFKLPHLKEMTLHNANLNTLRTLSKLHASSLEMLTLKNSIMRRRNHREWVNEALEAFCGSLKVFEFRMTEHEDYIFPMELKLRKLVVDFSQYKNCLAKHVLEFVLPFISLEHLVLNELIGCNCDENICSICTEDESGDARRQNLESDLISKLWEAVPKLNKVEITQPSGYSKETFVFARIASSD